MGRGGRIPEIKKEGLSHCVDDMLPMVADGFRQLLTKYTSTNLRRVITGFFFGMAFDSLLVHFHRACVGITGELVRLILGNTEAVNRAIEMFL